MKSTLLHSILELAGGILRWFVPALAFSVLLALFWGVRFMLDGNVSHGVLGASRFWDIAIPHIWTALFLLLAAPVLASCIPSWVEELLVWGWAWFLVSFLVGVGWGIELGLGMLAMASPLFPIVGWFFCVHKLRSNCYKAFG